MVKLLKHHFYGCRACITNIKQGQNNHRISLSVWNGHWESAMPSVYSGAMDQIRGDIKSWVMSEGQGLCKDVTLMSPGSHTKALRVTSSLVTQQKVTVIQRFSISLITKHNLDEFQRASKTSCPIFAMVPLLSQGLWSHCQRKVEEKMRVDKLRFTNVIAWHTLQLLSHNKITSY